MAGDRPQCLMFDADIIIFLHTAGLWDAITTSYQVVVPSIVVGEACYFLDHRHERQPIDLPAQIAAGRVTVLAASSDALAALLRRFNADLLEGLHSGEQEALALILSDSFPEGRLCSGDRLALVALAAIGFDTRGVSLEEALQDIGRSLDRTLRAAAQLTRAYFADAVAEGRRRRITGDGVTISLWDCI